MKRFGILLSIVFLMVGFSVSAETTTLIDFSELTADTEDGNNEATLVDFSDRAGPGYTDEERELMVTSLAIENWDVQLASSAQTTQNMRLSYTLEAPVREDAQRFAGQTVMGIRVHFPEMPFNSFAKVQPPFEIPAYAREGEQDREGSKFDGYGVVKNVGSLKQVSVNVYGSNYPNGFGIILQDEEGRERTLFLDYMDFNGWREIGWVNPNYIEDVQNRELRKRPLYPRLTPYRKLIGFIVYKDAQQQGGDVITYVKDVNLTYDLAQLPSEGAFDNEEIWGILEQREESRRNAEWSRLGELQVLRALEERKLHQEDEQQAQQNGNGGE